jgi:hypothetical protein
MDHAIPGGDLQLPETTFSTLTPKKINVLSQTCLAFSQRGKAGCDESPLVMYMMGFITTVNPLANSDLSCHGNKNDLR